MAAIINPIGAGLRFVERMTAGERLKAKQDRAANNALISEVLQMRPRDLSQLGPKDYRHVGNRLNIPPVRLHVLSDKESGAQGGFSRDGRLTILGEPAIFSKYTARAFDVESADVVTGEKLPPLSYPKFVKKREAHKLPAWWKARWGKHPYDFSTEERWQLWSMWATQNPEAAIMSISMGRFQVMGFHWQAMGFTSALEMLRFAWRSEANQLDLCIRWFKMNDMLDDLRRGSWYQVALYNGTGDRQKYADECSALEARRAGTYA